MGILPVTVSRAFLIRYLPAIETDPNAQLEVKSAAQNDHHYCNRRDESFAINGLQKHNMINGFDDIDYLQNERRNRHIRGYKCVLSEIDLL